MIPSTKYVDISTSYRGNNSVNRVYHGRVFSQNLIIPTATVLAFDGLGDVASYFGSDSLEAKQAGRYFGYTSPYGRSCSTLEFYRYTPSGSSAFILGTKVSNANLKGLQTVTNGQLTLTFNGILDSLETLDFSSALTLSAVAVILNEAWGVVKGAKKGDARGSKGTVSFNEVQQAFVFTVVTTGVSTVGVIGGMPDVVQNLGLLLPTVSLGSGVQTITTCFEESTDISDNFGSYTFSGIATDEEITEASILASNPSADYLYSFESTTDTFTVLETIGASEGTVANFDDKLQNTSLCPMAIFGATDFYTANGVVGYMFRRFAGMLPVVSDQRYKALDAKHVNYYGQTSKNGVRSSFYQDGSCTGTSRYLEVYTGSVHIKQALSSALLNLLLTSPRLPLGVEGEAVVSGIILANNAKFIEVGIIQKRELSETEEKDIITSWGKEALTSLEDSAYYVQTESIGVTIKYTLVYIAMVGVRKIEGLHTVLAVGGI